GIFGDDPFSYLVGRHTALMHCIGLQSLADADGALRGVCILKAAMQALVSHVHIAIAIARKLGERVGNILCHLISLLRRSYESVRRKSQGKCACARSISVIG